MGPGELMAEINAVPTGSKDLCGTPSVRRRNARRASSSASSARPAALRQIALLYTRSREDERSAFERSIHAPGRSPATIIWYAAVPSMETEALVSLSKNPMFHTSHH